MNNKIILLILVSLVLISSCKINKIDETKTCPAVCIPMYKLEKNIACPIDINSKEGCKDQYQCMYIECGSGCGPDNKFTFKTLGECQQKLIIQENKGVLKGKIIIDPICPVETILPDPKCQPTEETYKAYQVAVYNSNGQKITEINPTINGDFMLDLYSGNYIIDFDQKQNFKFSNNLPMQFIIKSNEITNANIDIDTGIR